MFKKPIAGNACGLSTSFAVKNRFCGQHAVTARFSRLVLPIEIVLHSRAYTLQVGSGKKMEDEQVRTWFVKATSVKKLDPCAKDSEGAAERAADVGEGEF